MRSSTRDVVYLANVTIDGTSFPLQMDTGSSDLWVDMGSFTPSNPVSAMTDRNGIPVLTVRPH